VDQVTLGSIHRHTAGERHRFRADAWRYTGFAAVADLLERLPDRIDSAAEHEIGEKPSGQHRRCAIRRRRGSRLLELRVRKLLAMGNISDAAALARAAPGLPTMPLWHIAEVEG